MQNWTRQVVMSASVLCRLSPSHSLVDPICKQPKLKPFGWSGLGLLASTAAAASASEMGLAKDQENPLFDFPKKKRSIANKCKPNFNWVSPSKSNLARKRYLPIADVEGFQKKQRLSHDRSLKLNVGSMGVQSTASVMPQCLKDGILKMGGSDIMLVIQKPLYKSDLEKQQARLSIPKNQVRSQFLTGEEEAVLDQNGGVRVKLIQPSVVALSTASASSSMSMSMSMSSHMLKKRQMGKGCVYQLVDGWNSVLESRANGLTQGLTIQLWSFRVQSQLCFALVTCHPY